MTRPKPPMMKGRPDDFQTPPEALWPLMDLLEPDWTIWECASGEGNLVRAMTGWGWPVIGTDILQDPQFDFLTYEPPHWDCIVTNPPYKYKTEFISRCYELGKPWALLMPLTTLEGQKRQPLFRENGVQIILFDRRINFKTPSGEGGGSWFMTAWFTWGLGLESELTFVEYADPAQARLNLYDGRGYL
jgi:hypothetical protein